jgi:hypothetical protein
MFIGLLIEVSEEGLGFGLWLVLSLHLWFSSCRPDFLAAIFVWGFVFYVPSLIDASPRFLNRD